ncbi:DUF5677 domain-containing protein [Planococcus sp. MERTA32b]|nr:DUF5677 domain-containing protein [Planococcus sp. MER TA 32b]
MNIEIKKIKRFINENEKFIEAISAKQFMNKVELDPIDKVILGIYISAIERSKAIILMKENNLHSPILSFLRIVFEGRVFIKFLLEDPEDAPRRGKLFMGSMLQKEIDTTLSTINNKHESTIKMTNERKNFYENRIRNIEEDTLYKYYIEEATVTKRKKWYAMINSDVKSFKDMCMHFGRGYSLNYDLFYTTASDDIHAKNGASRVNLKNGKIYFDDPLSDPVFDFTINKVIVENLIDMSFLISKHYDLERNYNLLFPSSKSLIKKTSNYTPKLNF